MKGLLIFIVAALIHGNNGQFGFPPPRGPRPGGGRGPPPGFGQGPPPKPSFSRVEDFLSEKVKSCLQVCPVKSKDLACPVLPQQAMTRSCRECLHWECPRDPSIPGFETESCEISRYNTCVNRRACPRYTTNFQTELSRCLRCRDNCIPNNLKNSIKKKLKEAANCRQRCSATSGCRAVPTTACKNCARRSCELANTRTATCVMVNILDARKCPACPNLSNSPPRNPNNRCRQCLATCAPETAKRVANVLRRLDDAKPDRDPYWRYVQFLPENAIRCLSSSCTSACPDAKTRRKNAKSIPESCKKCIESRCSRSPKTPGFDSDVCHRTAYATCGIANGCPILTTLQQSQATQCTNCENRCLSEAIKNDVRTKMAAANFDDKRLGPRGLPGGPGNNGRPFDREIAGNRPPGMAMRNLINGNREGMNLPESSSKCLQENCKSQCSKALEDRDENDVPCGQCISVLCPRKNYIPSFDNLKCRNGAHATCGPLFGCPVLSTEVRTRRNLCMTCVDNCIPESTKVKVRNQLMTISTCLDTCKTTSCGHRERCRNCVEQACKNSASKGCFESTRNSGTCPMCSFSTAQEQGCKSCLTKCRPAAVSGKTYGTGAPLSQSPPVASNAGVFVKPQQPNAESCAKQCQSGGCPIEAQVDACHKCLELACTDPGARSSCENYIIQQTGICACTYAKTLPPGYCKRCYADCKFITSSNVVSG